MQAKGRTGEEEESEIVGGSEVSESHLGLRMQGLSCTEQEKKDGTRRRGWDFACKHAEQDTCLPLLMILR